MRYIHCAIPNPMILTAPFIYQHTKYICSLFSQYGFTFASVSLATAYSIYRRPKNGMSIMLMTGAAGTIMDFLYGSLVACSNEVAQSQEYYIHQKQVEQQQQQQQQNVQVPSTDPNRSNNNEVER